MARAAKRSRRLWDTYVFPGFRPEQTVRGIFGDPKARVITLKRRSKKQLVDVAVAFRWGGTIARSAMYAIFPAATRGYFWKWRCGGSSAAGVARSSRNGSTFWGTIRSTPSGLHTMWASVVGRHRSRTWLRTWRWTGTPSRRWTSNTWKPSSRAWARPDRR